MDEKEIVIAVMQGDESAFEKLVKRYQHKGLRSAYLICQNQDLAQDILQETLVRCYLNISKLKNPMLFRPWFYTILNRTSLELMKKEKPYLLVEDSIENPPDPFHDSVWDSYLSADTYEILRKEIQELSVKQRTVLTMYYFSGLSVEEIAQATGSLTGTVKSRLFFARRNLKNKLLFQKNFVEEMEYNESK